MLKASPITIDEMTGKEIKAAISKYIAGQGSQARLQGLTEILSAIVDHENNIETQLSTIEVTISAYTQSNLTAEQAKQAGYTGNSCLSYDGRTPNNKV